MSSDKSNQYQLRCKFYNNYQLEIIPFDIEYISLIPYCINRIKSCFNIGKTFPLCPLHPIYPIFQGDFRFRVFFPKISNGGRRYNSHQIFFTKLIIKFHNCKF